MWENDIKERKEAFMEYLKGSCTGMFEIGHWYIQGIFRYGKVFAYGQRAIGNEYDSMFDEMSLIGIYDPATGKFYSNDYSFNSIDDRLNRLWDSIANDATKCIKESIKDDLFPMELDEFDRKRYEDAKMMSAYELNEKAVQRIIHNQIGRSEYSDKVKKDNISSRDLIDAMSDYEAVVRRVAAHYIKTNAISINIFICHERQIEESMANILNNMPENVVYMKNIIDVVAPIDAKRFTICIENKSGETCEIKVEKWLLMFRKDSEIKHYYLTNKEAEIIDQLFKERGHHIQPGEIITVSFRGKNIYNRNK